MAQHTTADAARDRLLANAGMLWAAAESAGQRGDAVTCAACAWGSDVYRAMAILGERQASASSRALLRSADVLLQRVAKEPEPEGSVADVVAHLRRLLRDAADPGLQRELQREWPEPADWAGLGAPSRDAFEEAARARLGALTPAAFGAARRAQARAAMDAAQAHRIAGRTAEAIQSAYESDLAVLEAYLVESAAAVADALLLTVTIRWEIAARAIGSIPGLPDAPAAAAERIRGAITRSLGPADGERLTAAFLPL